MEILVSSDFKCPYLKYWIPKFEMIRVKIDDFRSLLKLCHFTLTNSIQITQPKYHVTRAADVIWVPEEKFGMVERKGDER